MVSLLHFVTGEYIAVFELRTRGRILPSTLSSKRQRPADRKDGVALSSGPNGAKLELKQVKKISDDSQPVGFRDEWICSVGPIEAVQSSSWCSDLWIKVKTRKQRVVVKRRRGGEAA